MATKLKRFVTGLVLNLRGQDMVEYALMAATIAVAIGAVFPTSIAPNICTIFSKVSSTLNAS